MMLKTFDEGAMSLHASRAISIGGALYITAMHNLFLKCRLFLLREDEGDDAMLLARRYILLMSRRLSF